MREKLLKKFEDFYAGKEVVFYRQETEFQKRLLKVLELKVDEPWITDRDVFKRVKELFKVSYPTILQDILVIERMIANQKDPKGDPMKVWTRYFISEVTKEAIKKARDKDDGYTMAYAANIIGKHYLTDKEDIVKPDYDQIIPFNPELTSDPSVIGISLPENFEEIREKYRKKFDADYQRFIQKMTVPDAETEKEDED